MKNANRREFIKKSFSGVAGLTLASKVFGDNDHPKRKQLNNQNKFNKIENKMAKPNLLYVFCDQLRYDSLGITGNSQVETPNINKFAEESVNFSHAFSCSPICAPYRAQIITGKFAHKNGVIDNEYSLFEDQKTIHHVLQVAGYHTAHIGKWHLGYGPYSKEKRYGIDYMFAHNCDHHHYSVTYYENENGPIKTNEWSPKIETDKAIEFIESHQSENPEQPFSLFLGYGPPHNGYGGKKHLPYDMYPGEYNIYDPLEIDLNPNVPRPLAEFTRNEMADYYANITGLDQQFGRILKKLKELKLYENTIVCFSSDHGDHLRSYGYGGPWDKWLHHTKRSNKSTPHDESIHIPFIIRNPLSKNSKNSSILFSSVDVMPTLLSLCGLNIPSDVQGKNLAFAIRGEEGEEPDSVYLQILGTGWPTRSHFVGFWRGIRTKRYTYARWYDPDKFENGIWLFDRENDPYEMNNLAGKQKYKNLQTKLESRLKKWIKKMDDPFETGERDDQKGMLKLGQKFTHDKYENLF